MPIYRDRASVAVPVDDDDDDDDEEEEDKDEIDLDLHAEADGLGASFGEMRIDPALAGSQHTAVALGISSIVG